MSAAAAPPTVTIAIPVYNEERFIARTIESALAQTCPGLKILICDNHSTDNTFDIARKYAALDGRVILKRHDANVGAVGNFKHARDIASTTYFMWLGGHDVLQPGFVQEATQTLGANPQLSLVFPRSLFLDGDLLGASADSDIDTQGLNKVEGLRKLLRNLGTGTAIHGLFRTDFLKSCPLDTAGADDLLILFLTAASGGIAPSSTIHLHRRIVRKENPQEAARRYQTYGYATDVDYSLGQLTTFRHMEHILRIPGLTYRDKLGLLVDVRRHLAERLGGFQWPQVLRYFAVRHPDPYALISVLILLTYLMLQKAAPWAFESAPAAS